MGKTFIKITNKDIFDRLDAIDKKNDASHLDILLHQVQTNGKVKLNRWIATSVGVGLVTLAGWFLTHLSAAA